MDVSELTESEQIEILKVVWPDECALIGDYQLSRIASGDITITRPECGFNFDVVPFVQLFTAGLSLLAAFTSYREKRLSKSEITKEDEVAALVRVAIDASQKRAELDHDTIALLAREYVRVRDARRRS